MPVEVVGLMSPEGGGASEGVLVNIILVVLVGHLGGSFGGGDADCCWAEFTTGICRKNETAPWASGGLRVVTGRSVGDITDWK